MHIVLATSEAVPFAKTGGLADVCTALPKALDALGHRVSIFLPFYVQKYNPAKMPAVHSTGLWFPVQLGPKTVDAELKWSELPGTGVTVYHIHQPHYFDRSGIYNDRGQDYGDNCERFAFFSRAVLEACRILTLRPDVLHANDWQTGLIPALLNVQYRQQAGFQDCASIFTIHNMQYQGMFWHWDMQWTGMDWKYFNWQQMEAYSNLNLLKTGLVFADKITAVSPTYAQEIQTPEFGCGLDGVLQHRSADLVGILNGIDPAEWNPRTDKYLPANYDVQTFEQGKAACKQALQQQMGLPQRADVPLFVMVSRLAHQKGLTLIEEIIAELLREDVQLAFLGTGESHFEEMLVDLARRHSDKVAVRIGFSEELAHQMEAAGDLYLMPSLFEPCGLNQFYSMAYGTLPIVRATGGLADSVVKADKETLKTGDATGFSFKKIEGKSLLKAIQKALEMYRTDRANWKQMIRTGMSRDWSWTESARNYVKLYEAALAHPLPPQ